jgi:hypothetical protein
MECLLTRGIFINPKLTVTFCGGRKSRMIFKAFSSDISLVLSHVTTRALCVGPKNISAPRSLNLMALFARAMKKRLNSGLIFGDERL